MENMTISVGALMWVFGAIITIGGATTYIVKLLKPYKNLKDKVSKHEMLLANDDKRLKSVEDMTKLTSKTLLALVDHSITGNSMSKLKEVKTELQEFLINR